MGRGIMSEFWMMFDFLNCREWLLNSADALARCGYRVQSIQNDIPMSTLVLKFEGETAMAEMAVWDTGATSLMIADLRTGQYLLDRHGLVLTADFKNELQEFFELLRGKASQSRETTR